MSSPLGCSVNYGLRPGDFPLHYIQRDDTITLVGKYGRGTLMANLDVESAYWNVAAHHKVVRHVLRGFGPALWTKVCSIHLTPSPI